MAWRDLRSRIALKRGAGAALVAAGIPLMGAYALTDAEWREWERSALALSSPYLARPMPDPPQLEKPKDIRVLASAAMVKDFFFSTGYSLDAVRSGKIAVPRLAHISLPRDLKSISHAPDRKAVFLRFMLPYVLQANDRVRGQRVKLLTLMQDFDGGETWRPADRAWLGALFDEYRVKPGKFAVLVTRVDTVPPSLALAQSAVESGWGTSRFALEGNAPFGQWTSAAYPGIVPSGRDDGETHKIRAFPDLTQSVESYLRNLNTHRAYRKFRQRRAMLRAQNTPVDSLAIAEALSSYSQEGSTYVALVRRVITENNLRALDRARLSDTVVLFQPGA